MQYDVCSLKDLIQEPEKLKRRAKVSVSVFRINPFKLVWVHVRTRRILPKFIRKKKKQGGKFSEIGETKFHLFKFPYIPNRFMALANLFFK